MSTRNEQLDIPLRGCQKEHMEPSIHIQQLPEIKDPYLIAGFDGWGNALDVSKGMLTYLIRQLKAEYFARLNPDFFFRYDEKRPVVNIEDGILKALSPPEGSFYYARTGPEGPDLVLFRSDEPGLRWSQFVQELFGLCKTLRVKLVIAVGSMYDNVLHTDRVVSGVASQGELLSRLLEKDVTPINYQGPGAIHSTILSEAQSTGVPCISLWSHCPYYLQGTTHFGLLSHLGSLLAEILGFELNTDELETSWKELNKQIQGLVEKNPELQAMINNLVKAKVKGSWENIKETGKVGEKIIDLKDFLKPK